MTPERSEFSLFFFFFFFFFFSLSLIITLLCVVIHFHEFAFCRSFIDANNDEH